VQADVVGGVTRDDLVVWDQEFQDVCARLGGLFYRTDSRAHARHYVRGLIAPLERKNGWTIAEYAGELEPKALQRLLNLSPWDADEARDLVRTYAMEHFADPRGVLIADPTGFAKKGTKSAGAQRQYSGTLGRIDNCQIGVFLAYANTAGDRVLIDRELYMPEESWCADPDRRAEARVPEELVFATRPQQVQDMIERTVTAGGKHSGRGADLGRVGA
jgi:SRSO17 transposase